MLGGWLRDKAESLSRLGVSTMAPVGDGEKGKEARRTLLKGCES